MFSFDISDEQRLHLTESILAGCNDQTLYLLGVIIDNKKHCSIFSKSHAASLYVSHYFILSLVGVRDAGALAALQDKIENNLQHCMPATVIVLNANQFNDWLKEGNPFACETVQKGMMLHNSGYCFCSPASVNTAPLSKKNSTNLILVNEFITGAELYQLRKQYHMAAFMLHQAAEHALRTLLQITCGLWINTHNLDKLVRYCSMATCRVKDVFNRESPKEKQLFSKLQSAYIDVRYKEYSISEWEITQLNKKVNAIIELVHEVYEEPL